MTRPKVYDRHRRFKEGLETFLETMNVLTDSGFHGTQKMLHWCLNVLEKIVAKYLKKSS